MKLQPDVVLMDITCPGSTACRRTKWIKEARPEAIGVGLSVNNSLQVRDVMLVAGASAFLTKEAETDRLYEVVSKRSGVRGR